MRKLLTIIAFLSLLTFWACKKKSSPSNPPSSQIGMSYDDSSKTTYYYYYAPDRRISGMHDSKGHYWYHYHYNSGNQIEVKTEVWGQYDSTVPTTIYIKNNQGLVDSSFEVFQNGDIGNRKQFYYDANNYLLNVKWYNRQNVGIMNEYYTVANGNIVQHSYAVFDSTNQTLPRGTSSYSYFTDKNNSLGNTYIGEDFFGASSKNPVKSWTYSNGGISTTAFYTYGYDQSGLINSQIVYNDSSGVSVRVDSINYNFYYIQ